MTIEELRNSGMIAFEYIRGSHAYGLNTENSDEDHGGVFICPKEMLYGFRSKYIEQVSDAKGDTVFYEFGRWIELLLKANPTALEGLFIPERCIIGKVHPMVQEIINHRDMFLSKECFKTLTGYAVSQISKARGLKKKIVNPITERKTVLDFCYTFKGQGSQPMKEFLEEHGIKQENCGLVNIPNMKDVYSVFYDSESNYRGIMDDDSCDVKLSSVKKGAEPICQMYFNHDSYSIHCREYKEYKEWEKNRNPIRYESNLGENYDGKNMCHCMRLTRMGKELALGQGFNIERTYDRDYLLSIKNHKLEYSEIIAQANKEKEEMNEAIKTCKLPDFPNYEAINKLLIDIRMKFYN